MSLSGGSSQIQNDPIYSLPHLYISGLNISAASTTVLAIAPGQARDSSDNIDMPVGFPNLQGNTYPATLFQNYIPPLFLNSAVVGANGLDAGVLVLSTQYCVYLIGDSRGYQQVAGLISLASNPYPLLPQGYDSFRLLGFVITDGSAHFLAANISNMVNAKAYYLQPAASVLSGGNSTTYAEIDLSGSIADADVAAPAVTIALLNVTFTPAAVGDLVYLRPGGSAATTNVTTISGIAAGVPQQQYIQVICGDESTDAAVDYKVTSSSDAVTILLAGYIVTLT